MGKYSFDFESFDAEGSPQIVMLPQKSDKHFYYDSPQEVTFKCNFDYNIMKARKFFKALVLPERKFVRWRKKKMLVSKTRQQVVLMNTNFDSFVDGWPPTK